MAISPARILVVDDFEPWRKQVCAILQLCPNLNVIAQAEDGLEAVRKAEELKPDLILLDVGMPRLNGIETAKIILQKCPKSQILFVTQDDDDDIRCAAMRLGAAGYVLKKNVGNELLGAITTALYHCTAVPVTKSR